jgi:1,4-dihydroxy-2-naphthoate octaprenyltransferase
MTGLGQGGLTFAMVLVSLDHRSLAAFDGGALLLALAASALLLGIFPLTQIYQHEEDARRGDLTISRLLGIKGSFLLAGVFLGLGLALLALRIFGDSGGAWLLAFALSQSPALALYLSWFLAARADPARADFRSSMRMNLLASTLLNLFLIAYLVLR